MENADSRSPLLIKGGVRGGWKSRNHQKGEIYITHTLLFNDRLAEILSEKRRIKVYHLLKQAKNWTFMVKK